MSKTKQDAKRKAPVCPRCGHHIPDDATPGLYPGALSRWDNATEICSSCGTIEAMRQMGFEPGGPLDREQWWDRTGKAPDERRYGDIQKP